MGFEIPLRFKLWARDLPELAQPAAEAALDLALLDDHFDMWVTATCLTLGSRGMGTVRFSSLHNFVEQGCSRLCCQEPGPGSNAAVLKTSCVTSDR